MRIPRHLRGLRMTFACVPALLILISALALAACGSYAASPDTSVDSVEGAVRQLEWGSTAFDAPPAMRYQESQIVRLLVSASHSPAELENRLKDKAGAASARIRISNRMEAKLTGEGFTIESLGPELQAVRRHQDTTWRWEVTPTRKGRPVLHLALFAHLSVAGQDAPLVIRTFDRRIGVDVTPAQVAFEFVGNNWQWLWAAVLVPIATLGYHVWKKRRSGPGGAGPGKS